MVSIRKLRPLDRLNILGLCAITAVAVIYHARVHAYLLILGINLLVTIALLFLQSIEATGRGGVPEFISRWYSIPLIFLTFKEMYFMVHPINPHDMDYLLIRLDRLIFGTDPTHVLDRIATPGLTEFLQICYSSFYLLWIILGVDLLINKNEGAFLYFLFVLMLGFYLSYAGYLFVPAIGPRFTLYNFALLNEQLPGLYLTSTLRHIIDSGESISNVARAAMQAQRDCFPSGHTEMTLITIATAMKYRAKSAMIILPLGAGLIFATVYMRYHYGVDVIAGVLVAVLVLSTGSWLERRFRGAEVGSK